MMRETLTMVAGVIVTLAIVYMAGYATVHLAKLAPARAARVLLALTALLGAIPAILWALYGIWWKA